MVSPPSVPVESLDLFGSVPAVLADLFSLPPGACEHDQIVNDFDLLLPPLPRHAYHSIATRPPKPPAYHGHGDRLFVLQHKLTAKVVP
jgi:hypothetical protein